MVNVAKIFIERKESGGHNGQTIMIFPDLDVVVVTTGRAGFKLGELAEYISNSVKSDTPVPPDETSAKLLADKIVDVSTEKPTGVGPTPKMAALISGKVYRFARNELSVKSLSLILTGPQPHYDMEIYARNAINSDPRLTDPIGLDGLYRRGGLSPIFSGPLRLTKLFVKEVNKPSHES
jgi:hypothetical protein